MVTCAHGNGEGHRSRTRPPSVKRPDRAGGGARIAAVGPGILPGSVGALADFATSVSGRHTAVTPRCPGARGRSAHVRYRMALRDGGRSAWAVRSSTSRPASGSRCISAGSRRPGGSWRSVTSRRPARCKERALAEMVRVTKPGGCVGLNEGFLLAGTPSPRVTGLARRIGSAMVTLGIWRVLWDASGLNECVVRAYRLDPAGEIRDRFRWVGFRRLLAGSMHAVRLYLTEPSARPVLDAMLASLRAGSEDEPSQRSGWWSRRHARPRFAGRAARRRPSPPRRGPPSCLRARRRAPGRARSPAGRSRCSGSAARAGATRRGRRRAARARSRRTPRRRLPGRSRQPQRERAALLLAGRGATGCLCVTARG